MKPKIIYTKGRWVCYGGDKLFYGDCPITAFSQWLYLCH